MDKIIKLFGSWNDLRYPDKYYLSQYATTQYDLINSNDEMTDDEKNFIDFYETNTNVPEIRKNNAHFSPHYRDDGGSDSGLFHMYINEDINHILYLHDDNVCKQIIEVKLLILAEYIECFYDYTQPYDIDHVKNIYETYAKQYKKY